MSVQQERLWRVKTVKSNIVNTYGEEGSRSANNWYDDLDNDCNVDTDKKVDTDHQVLNKDREYSSTSWSDSHEIACRRQCRTNS